MTDCEPPTKRSRVEAIPTIGYGTYKLSPGQTESCVLSALNAGYRLIDTAQVFFFFVRVRPSSRSTALVRGSAYTGLHCTLRTPAYTQVYKNERGVGAAIKKSGLPRESVFVTSKVWRTSHGYERTRNAVLGSLREVGLEYIDLMLVHWPGPKTGWPLKRGDVSPPDWTPAMRDDTWRALEDLHSEGKLRHIGVANYARKHLEQLLESCRTRPYLNQIELHPLLQQKDLVDFCRSEGIAMQAYASLGGSDGGGQLVQEKTVEAVARSLGRTPAQVLLRWALDKGFRVIPKTQTEQRMRENIRSDDFDLPAEQMRKLDALEMGRRLTWRGLDPSSIE